MGLLILTLLALQSAAQCSDIKPVRVTVSVPGALGPVYLWDPKRELRIDCKRYKQPEKFYFEGIRPGSYIVEFCAPYFAWETNCLVFWNIEVGKSGGSFTLKTPKPYAVQIRIKLPEGSGLLQNDGWFVIRGNPRKTNRYCLTVGLQLIDHDTFDAPVIPQGNYDAQILSPSGSVMASGSFSIDSPSDVAKVIDLQMTEKQSPQ